MARILIIDDDPDLLDVLALAVRDAGDEPSCARDGVEGLARIDSDRPDAVICDVNMPRLDGFALCRKLRGQGNQVPLIMLTSRDSEVDEALGLELGADDYVPKPFSTRVLLARIAALLRREALRGGAGGPAPVPALRVGDLQLDGDRLEVRYLGQPIAVTVTEFRLLDALARRPGLVQSRDRLLDLARGDETVVADRIIDTYVRRLRRKFESVDPGFDRIETVIGAGYRWRE
ncbi:MAG: response regulator transcription factor [Deltaproteobacteria bacterium]|nr:response regulator transcription factor [Deltaproteobacteria bacterium]